MFRLLLLLSCVISADWDYSQLQDSVKGYSPAIFTSPTGTGTIFGHVHSDQDVVEGLKRGGAPVTATPEKPQMDLDLTDAVTGMTVEDGSSAGGKPSPLSEQEGGENAYKVTVGSLLWSS